MNKFLDNPLEDLLNGVITSTSGSTVSNWNITNTLYTDNIDAYNSLSNIVMISDVEFNTDRLIDSIGNIFGLKNTGGTDELTCNNATQTLTNKTLTTPTINTTSFEVPLPAASTSSTSSFDTGSLSISLIM